MEINDIVRLMQAVSENGLTCFKLEEGNIKLCIKKEKKVADVCDGQALKSLPKEPEDFLQVNEVSEEKSQAGIDSGQVVCSPLVGTFYNAASPEAEPFVKVGDKVKKGQTLGIIEAMKLMNEIESEYDGVIEAILAGNEDVVEYGQPLFRIR